MPREALQVVERAGLKVDCHRQTNGRALLRHEFLLEILRHDAKRCTALQRTGIAAQRTAPWGGILPTGRSGRRGGPSGTFIQRHAASEVAVSQLIAIMLA